MKVISIWQPWASLIVHGHKVIETRGWPAPKSVIGQRIGIAATKTVKPEQRVHYLDPNFQRYYRQTGLPELDELPKGCILGTVELFDCEPIGADFTDDITSEEEAFGWFTPGRYAWRVRRPMPFPHPVVARGAQGIWEWDPHGALKESYDHTGQEGPQGLWRYIHAS